MSTLVDIYDTYIKHLLNKINTNTYNIEDVEYYDVEEIIRNCDSITELFWIASDMGFFSYEEYGKLVEEIDDSFYYFYQQKLSFKDLKTRIVHFVRMSLIKFAAKNGLIHG